MRRILSVLILMLAASASLAAQTATKTTTAVETESAEQVVLKLTNEWLDAEGRHDRTALERIIADDFLGTAPMGNTVGKRDVIPSGTGRAGGLSMTAQDIKVRPFGDTAIVTGRGIGKGQDGVEVRFTVVFVKRQNQWQMVAGHISPMPREE
ncbi:MAG TPA: nuclear transport factor 2 family protein [Pyrinomonadaceae bacterium]|jgi:ketosteroid isomerase-like protein|nr:nuclear transport factor 2 family protein [Pyrinomonadaceae bacterium]